MALYLVACDAPQPAMAKAVAAREGSHMWTQDRLFMVPSDGSAQTLTNELTAVEGVVKSGILVIKIQADYYGLSNNPNWEWLAAAFRREIDG